MTLEGTIVYAEKQAEWMSKYSDIGEYESRSEYYRQLAEWLRELKKYKESDMGKNLTSSRGGRKDSWLKVEKTAPGDKYRFYSCSGHQ